MPRWAWAITPASVGEVRLASSPPLPLRLAHNPSTGFSSGVGRQPLDHQPDAKLAGDLRLTEAGGEQLGGTKPAGLEAVTLFVAPQDGEE